ncbi:efflux RND transporter periplasmic adaptor subunit [Maribellus sp. YY47]|uniref:efflux RND transporter periplasmic adaptor subunit n=1 Tax=Maribellus sp. YY47 TaxID=2929486 RepID=UPI002000E8F4|nr:efflux RND transporter periplasmic adaptor subunit [Maribellus sp. YY47]MCK3683714.1 efflux RND transporter periplasmic adaptor subunit [Maribellus sp. YY47]
MKKILIILTTALFVYACASTSVEDDNTKREKLQELKQQVHTLEQQITQLEKELSANQEEETIKIKAETLTQKRFEHFFEVTGQVEAEHDVDVSPETSGVIKEVLVKEGQQVTKGQIMARLNTDILERSIDELQVQLDLAVTNYERQKNLWDQNIGSEMQYLQAKNNKESLETRIKSLKTQIELAEVKVPSDGIVDVIYQKKGNIGSPQTPFAKVVDVSHIKIYGDISESYITKVHRGDSVKIYFPALNTNTMATIYQVGNTVDQASRTFRVRINIENPGKLIKPNLVAVLKFRDYLNKNAIVVPTLFIKEDFTGHYTYIVDQKDGKTIAKKVYVEPGVTDNNLTEVVSGLNTGMQVVSEGYNQIVNGSLVSIN